MCERLAFVNILIIGIMQNMQTRIKLVVASVALGVAVALNIRYHLESKHPAVHHHAGFTVYINGVRQDFAQTKYMNFAVCSDHQHKATKEEEQIEKAHLHEMVGDVVHVHRSGATWGDLFENIKFELPSNVYAVVGGEVVAEPLASPIEDNTSVVFVVGEKPDDMEIVTKDHIGRVAASSELCGD